MDTGLLSFFSSEHVQRLWSHVGISPLSEIPTYLAGLNPLAFFGKRQRLGWYRTGQGIMDAVGYFLAGLLHPSVMQVSITQ